MNNFYYQPQITATLDGEKLIIDILETEGMRGHGVNFEITPETAPVLINILERYMTKIKN